LKNEIKEMGSAMEQWIKKNLDQWWIKSLEIWMKSLLLISNNNNNKNCKCV
jgi:hypothetical protein